MYCTVMYCSVMYCIVCMYMRTYVCIYVFIYDLITEKHMVIPVVPARGGAEVALGIYYKTFLIYRERSLPSHSAVSKETSNETTYQPAWHKGKVAKNLHQFNRSGRSTFSKLFASCWQDPNWKTCVKSTCFLHKIDICPG